MFCSVRSDQQSECPGRRRSDGLTWTARTTCVAERGLVFDLPRWGRLADPTGEDCDSEYSPPVCVFWCRREVAASRGKQRVKNVLAGSENAGWDSRACLETGREEGVTVAPTRGTRRHRIRPKRSVELGASSDLGQFSGVALGGDRLLFDEALEERLMMRRELGEIELSSVF